MAFRTDLNVDLFLGRTCYKSISAVAGNSCLMVFWMDSFSHFIHLFLILLSSQIYSDDFVFQADKISSTLHSFLIVSHNFENCKPYTIFVSLKFESVRRCFWCGQTYSEYFPLLPRISCRLMPSAYCKRYSCSSGVRSRSSLLVPDLAMSMVPGRRGVPAVSGRARVPCFRCL